MAFKDYYKILGLENSKCSYEQIKSAYRVAAKKYHPDINIGNSYAEEQIKDINEAYTILSDVTKRKKYDRRYNAQVTLKNSIFGQNKKPNKVIYDMIFGQEEENLVTSGTNIETYININLKEGFNGCKKMLSIKSTNKKVEINIPKGVKNYETIKIKGYGKKSSDGGKPGDLIVKVILGNYHNYKVEKDKIYYQLNLSPIETVLGKQITIENLETDEDDIILDIPPLTNSGQTFIIKENGYIKNNQREDLEVQVAIVCPPSLSKEEKELYEQINKISQFIPR